MKGVIMAGGFGTRLKPLTIQRPKPMVPVANRPMMEHIVGLLRSHGITDLVSILYFQPDHITSHFGDGGAFGVNMRYVTADADYGTAGAVRNAADLLADERVLVISGDLLTDFDLGAMISEHEARGAEATIALTSVEDPLAYGIVIIDRATGRIERFLEKPTWGEVFSDTINTGIYVLEPAALQRVPARTNFDFSKDLYPRMLHEGAGLFGHVARGYWRDIGNLDEYRRAHADILQQRVSLQFCGERDELDGAVVWRAADSTIVADVSLRGTIVIGRGARIEAGVILENVVIGDGARVGAGASLRDVVLWEGCVIGNGARISESVCARAVTIGEGAIVREQCILADGAVVGAFAVVGPNVKVWPEKVVEERAALTHSLIWGEAWQRSLFHGARVSGVPNYELTPEIAARLGGAYGALLGTGAFVVTSRDSDRASRMINRAFMTGFLSTGVNVEDLRQMPIPVVRHAVHYGRETGGIHVRRSPFDSKIIDILFFDDDGRDLAPGKTQSIERLFSREDYPRAGPEGTGDVNFPSRIVEGYQEHLLSAVSASAIAERRFNIVLDYAYGTTVEVFPRLMGAVGAETIGLNAYSSPGRPSRGDVEFHESMDRLGGIVRSVRADLGVWVDPGGEVVYFVDNSGRPLTDQLLQGVVVSLALAQLDVRSVAIPVTTPQAVVDIVRAAGVEPVWTKTEHHSMMGSAKEVDLVAGVRGEFIFSSFMPAYDGIFATLKVLEALVRSGARLDEVAASLPGIHMVEQRVACPWGRKGTVMRELMEATEQEPRQLVDGVKLWRGERAWVLVIPHSHKPYFVITAEGPDAGAAAALAGEFVARVEGWRDA
jgi:mannose-1-phosphate guanylyltransferase / phosphomannomutase